MLTWFLINFVFRAQMLSKILLCININFSESSLVNNIELFKTHLSEPWILLNAQMTFYKHAQCDWITANKMKLPKIPTGQLSSNVKLIVRNSTICDGLAGWCYLLGISTHKSWLRTKPFGMAGQPPPQTVSITIVSQGQLMGVSIVSEVNARLGRARHVIRCVCCTCNRLLANGQIHTMSKGSSCWKLEEEWTYTHIHIIYPPLYVCIWVMVHIRTCVVCMCYGRVCLVTLAPRCVANYTPAAHTHPSPYSTPCARYAQPPPPPKSSSTAKAKATAKCLTCKLDALWFWCVYICHCLITCWSFAILWLLKLTVRDGCRDNWNESSDFSARTYFKISNIIVYLNLNILQLA